jgi:O-antigen/teichoic acid export membrane protein
MGRSGYPRRVLCAAWRVWNTHLVVGPIDTAAQAPRDAVDSPHAGRLFVRGGAKRVAAYGGAIACSVAVIPLVTRHLGASKYGQLGAVVGLMLIAAIITEGGIGTIGIREYANLRGAARNEFMRGLIGLRIALSAAGALGALAFAALAYPPVQVAGTAIAAIGLVLTNLQVTLAIPLTAELRIGWVAAIDIAAPVATAAALVALVVFDAPFLLFFAAPLASYGVALAITATLVRGSIPLRPNFSPRSWRSLLRNTALYAAATALGTVYFRVVLVAMSLLAGHTEVGVFALAFRTLDVLSTLPWLLVVSVWPILVRAARDERHRLRFALNRLIEGNLLLGGWISLLVVTGGPFAAKVLGGPQYPGAGEVLRILGTGIGCTFLVALFAFALLSLQRIRLLIAINTVILLLSILLCVLLIPDHGARGGAIVTVSLEVTLACAYAFALFTLNPDLRPALGRSARILAALALAFVVALAAPVSSLASAVIGTAVFVPAVLALRALPPELLDAVRLRQ